MIQKFTEHLFRKWFIHLLVAFLSFTKAFSQAVEIISVTAPARINVCGDGTTINGALSKVIVNARLVNGAAGTFTVQLPVGFSYIAGSVAGLGYSEANISNLNAPIFTALSGNYNNMEILIAANCNFTATRTITATATTMPMGLSGTATSGAIANVDLPNILQLSWTNDAVNGICVGDVVTRTITIKNGDIGYAKNFIFKSENDPSSVQIISTSITSPVTQLLTGTTVGNTTSYEIAGAVFPTGGLGDTYFDDGETITITQVVKIIGCGNLAGKTITEYGCAGTPQCQVTEHNNIINLGTGVPSISISRIQHDSFSLCSYGNSEAAGIWEITNTGVGTCSVLKFSQLNALFGNSGKIVEIRMQNSSGTIVPYVQNGNISAGYMNFSGFTADPDGAGGFDDINGDGIFDELPAGAKIRVYIKISVPVYAGCKYDVSYNDMTFEYQLATLCGGLQNKTISPNNGLVFAGRGGLVQTSSPSDMADGDFAHLKGKLNYQILGWDCPNPVTKIKLVLPKGFVFDNSNTLFPLVGSMNLTNPVIISVPAPAADTVYFDAPNMVGGDYFIPIRLDCALGTGMGALQVIAQYQCAVGCAPLTLGCHTYPIMPHCPGLSCASGIAITGLKVERQSLGFTDFSLTTKVDPTTINSDGNIYNDINLNQASACDTIKVSGTSNTTLSQVNSNFSYEVRVPETINNGSIVFNHSTITGANPLSWLSGTININGVVSTLGPPVSITKVGTEYVFNFDLNGFTPIPTNSSVKVDVLFTINKLPFPNYFDAQIYDSQVRAKFIENGISCDDFGDHLYLLDNTLGSFFENESPLNINGCSDATFSQRVITGGHENSYPNEVRLAKRVDKIEITLPDGVTFNGTANFKNGEGSEAPMTGTQVGNLLTLYPTPGNNQYFYQNFPRVGTFTVGFKADCKTPIDGRLNWSLFTTDYMHSSAGCQEPGIANQIDNNTNNLLIKNPFYGNNIFSNTKPNIIINNANTTIVTDPFSWTFTVNNASTASLNNLFLSFENPSNTMTFLSLEDVTGGGSVNIPITAYDGTKLWTNIGAAATLSGLTSRTFKLTASSTNCAADQVIVKAGWDCVALPSSPDAYTCDLSTGTLFSNVGNTGVSLQVNTITPPLQDLCNPISITAQLRTTDLGHAYNNIVTATLPFGLTYLAGTGEYEFPAGSGNWLPVTPTMDGQVLTFDLSTLLPSTGLFGTADATNNNDKVNIRFQAKADCNFASGSRISFIGSASSSCGKSALSNTQYSDTINISGVPVDLNHYAVSQTIENATDCEIKTVRNITLQIINTSNNPTNAANESIRVVLPEGATYVPNSSINPGACTFYLGSPVIGAAMTGDTLKWNMPAGVTQNGTLCVNYQINLPDNCNSKDITAFTQYGVFATCTVGPFAPVSCSDLKVITGTNTTMFLTPQRPTWQISSFSYLPKQSDPITAKSVAISGAFSNTSTIDLPAGQNVIVDYFWDSNCDGVGDTYISSSEVVYSGVIAAGATTPLTTNFTTDYTNHLNDCIVAKIARVSATTGETCTCNETSAKAFIAQVLISGTVFNDVNGLLGDNTVNGTPIQNPSGTQLYANLADVNGIVIASAPIDASGNYSFSLTPGSGTTYTVNISTNQGVVDQPLPANVLPSDWVATGENIGLTAGSDGTPNLVNTVTVGTTDIPNINFGIEQPPTAVINVDATVINLGGTNSEPVSSTLFTGTDPTAAGTVDFIRITAFPTGATSITIDGTTYTSATFPAEGVTIPAVDGVITAPISVDPSFTGAGDVVIPYVTVDNAGISSPVATVTQPFVAPVNVSGTVFNDPNATNVNNSSGEANLVPSGMFANLIGSDGNVLATTPIATDGTYSFANITPGTYTVVSGITEGTVGQPAPSQTWPTGWLNTGDFNGTPDSGNTNTTPNVSASFTVVTSDVPNINFGIQQPPTAVTNVDATVTNPGGTVSEPVTSALFTGTDPTTGGTVDFIKITAFPTGATSITIDGTTYTSANFPVGGVTIPAVDGVITAPISIDPSFTGAGDVVIPYVTIDNAGVSSPEATVTQPFIAAVNVSGNVFNDPNATNVNNSSGEANSVPSGMFANLIGSDGNVVATTPIATDGTYSFANVVPGDYTVVSGTTEGTIGQPAPMETWPTGWVNTGDFNGTPDTGNTNTTPNVSAVFTVATIDVPNINFGIQQPPTAVTNVDATVTNPGGTVSEPVTSALFTGTDPTTGGTVDFIKITAFPTGATSITIDGTTYTSANFPAGGVTIPAVDGVITAPISVDPSFTGAGDVVIPYVTIDNAGVSSPEATVTQSFIAAVTVSGTVFNDPNATNVNNSSGEANSVPSGMFANLIGSDGNVVATTPIATDGTYSFANVVPGDYTVVSGTTEGTIGQPAPMETWPTGWVNTGDFNGTPDTGNTNTTPNVSAVFTVATTDVPNINFGIQQPPTAVTNVDPTVTNPGGTALEPVASDLFTGTDPTTGGTVDFIKITAFPTGATSITIDGTTYTSANFPAGGVTIPAVDGVITAPISVDPSFTGTGDVVIPYVTIDNAGVSSPEATVTQSFTLPLPIDLISFSGKQNDQQLILTWKTANEKDFSHFEVQKSSDAREFGTMGIINGKNATIYNYIDTKPINGLNYYRLKMVDLDGTTSLSKVISVNFEKEGTYVTVENPAKNGAFNLKTNLKNPRFSLLSSVGRKVELDIIETAKNSFVLNAKTKTAGMYYITIVSDSKVITKKVIIP